MIDCSVDRDPSYPLAYEKHRQTYWLKWIVLRLIDHANGHALTFEELYSQLHELAGYEEHLVRLVVGSLATPNKAGCISIRYKNHSIGSRELSLTKRGMALVREGHSKVLLGIPFCFSFDYLQLVADDPLMTFPKLWADSIVPTGASLDYALRERDEYHRRALEYLRKKMPSTLIFLRLLETSWDRELKFINTLDGDTIKNLSPNFPQIRETLLGAYKAILVSWTSEREELFAELSMQSQRLQADKSFGQFWEVFGE